jgi:hypothetical protein
MSYITLQHVLSCIPYCLGPSHEHSGRRPCQAHQHPTGAHSQQRTIALHHIPFHSVLFHSIRIPVPFNYITLHYITLHYILLHYMCYWNILRTEHQHSVELHWHPLQSFAKVEAPARLLHEGLDFTKIVKNQFSDLCCNVMQIERHAWYMKDLPQRDITT